MSLDGVIRLARLGFIELFRTDEHGRDIVVRMALYDFGMFRFFVPVDGYLAVCRIFFNQFSQGFFSALAIGAAIEIKGPGGYHRRCVRPAGPAQHQHSGHQPDRAPGLFHHGHAGGRGGCKLRQD